MGSISNLTIVAILLHPPNLIESFEYSFYEPFFSTLKSFTLQPLTDPRSLLFALDLKELPYTSFGFSMFSSSSIMAWSFAIEWSSTNMPEFGFLPIKVYLLIIGSLFCPNWRKYSCVFFIWGLPFARLLPPTIGPSPLIFEFIFALKIKKVFL